MPTVLLAAEDAVPYQDVVRLHDACVAAGLSRVLLR
jgi:biopolymer transport protein ExbD